MNSHRRSHGRTGHDLIVVGASAGGVEALMTLVRSLPADLAAAICIVVHMPPDSPSLLPRLLTRAGALPAHRAEHGQRLTPGQIAIAPPDYHLIVRPGHLELSHGPRENRNRPAIDVLFRSAALAYGPRVVGVILTGTLDDGTAGMRLIKARGGVAVVQDPTDALFPSMPLHVIEAGAVDHVLPVAEMPELLTTLSREPASGGEPATEATREEVAMADADLSLMMGETHPGTPSVFACPDCGGVLWELNNGDLVHYRCRVGHAFSADSLLEAQADGVEGALWMALRALEEQADLAQRLEARAHAQNHPRLVERYAERFRQAEANAAKLRQLLLAGTAETPPPAKE